MSTTPLSDPGKPRKRGSWYALWDHFPAVAIVSFSGLVVGTALALFGVGFLGIWCVMKLSNDMYSEAWGGPWWQISMIWNGCIAAAFGELMQGMAWWLVSQGIDGTGVRSIEK